MPLFYLKGDAGMHTTTGTMSPSLISLTPIAQQILTKRYFKTKEDGTQETWEDLCHRVANHIARAEITLELQTYWAQQFYDLIHDLWFLPNSPCLVNAGTNIGGLLACFVVPLEDSIDGIAETKKSFMKIAQKGGGCGTTLSNLRPKGNYVAGSTHAQAGGPIAFLRTISSDMIAMTQSGFRDMACMATMRVDHPDILECIRCKTPLAALQYTFNITDDEAKNMLDEGIPSQVQKLIEDFLHNFNISIMVTDEFMEAVHDNKDYNLTFDGKIYKTLSAKEVFKEIAKNAWTWGDPGLMFYNKVNSEDKSYTEEIQSSNPCGEQQLPPYGSCNLGSLNLTKFVTSNGKVNWDLLADRINIATRFLDNVIDMNQFPTPKIEDWASRNRPIGLGVMGWADMLINMKMAYGSQNSYRLAKQVMSFIHDKTNEVSVSLANEKGMLNLTGKGALENIRRNTCITSIAPTGSISLLANCSSGVEPCYSDSITRTDKTGTYHTTHPSADEKCFRCAVSEKYPDKILSAEAHIRMQAAFQNNGVTSSISKTINLAETATIEDVLKAYQLAWELDCKGITIYRDKSRTSAVLSTGIVTKPTTVKRSKLISPDILTGGYRAKIQMFGKEGEKITYYLQMFPNESGQTDELFLSSSHPTEADFCAIIGRLGTMALRRLDPDEMEAFAKQLEQGQSTRGITTFLRHRYASLGEALAAAFREGLRHFSGTIINLIPTATVDTKEVVLGQKCPKCKQMTFVVEAGCKVCKNDECMYSKCG